MLSRNGLPNSNVSALSIKNWRFSGRETSKRVRLVTNPPASAVEKSGLAVRSRGSPWPTDPLASPPMRDVEQPRDAEAAA
jgi:hypothetical protein